MSIQRSSWHVIAEIHRAARESKDLPLAEALILQCEIVLPAMLAHTKALHEASAACRVQNPLLKKQIAHKKKEGYTLLDSRCDACGNSYCECIPLEDAQEVY